MTQIHPEAIALIEKHEKSLRPSAYMNEGWTREFAARNAVSDALKERDALKSAADDVYNRLMPEVTELREKLAQAVEIMKPFARFSQVKETQNRTTGDVIYSVMTMVGTARITYTDTDAAAKFVKENENGQG